jgi:hypothetical protein
MIFSIYCASDIRTVFLAEARPELYSKGSLQKICDAARKAAKKFNLDSYYYLMLRISTTLMRIRLFSSMWIRFFTWTRIQIRGLESGYYLRSRILNKVWGSATLTSRPSAAPESGVGLHGSIVSLQASIIRHFTSMRI